MLSFFRRDTNSKIGTWIMAAILPSGMRAVSTEISAETGATGRTVGISRDRLISNDGMNERVRIVIDECVRAGLDRVDPLGR